MGILKLCVCACTAACVPLILSPRGEHSRARHGLEALAALTVTFVTSQRGKHDLHLDQSFQLPEHTCRPVRYATQLFVNHALEGWKGKHVSGDDEFDSTSLALYLILTSKSVTKDNPPTLSFLFSPNQKQAFYGS